MKNRTTKSSPPGFGSLEINNWLATPIMKKGYFSRDECQAILGICKTLPESDAATGIDGKQADSAYRNTKITFIYPSKETAWIHDKIKTCVLEANKLYKFDIMSIPLLQVGKYTVGSHFDWHLDLGTDHTSQRKLTVVVQLSGHAEYEGGDTEFSPSSLDIRKAYRKIGSVTIFPSYLAHRVTPVTRGTRWSMVAWVSGNPYK